MAHFTDQERLRYQRQIQLPEIGVDGQMRLKQARVLIIGLGGLGSPSALYLAAAGVGVLGLIDGDSVSLSNLHRQVLYSTKASGEKKVEKAKSRLNGLNPEIEIVTHSMYLNEGNILEVFRTYDVVVDGSDSLETRYLVSRACVTLRKPHVYAGLFRFEGHVAVFSPDGGPCYACLFPQKSLGIDVPNCGESGVLGAVAGMIGSLQALEALKVILQQEQFSYGRLFVFDALTLDARTLQVNKAVDCEHCGPKRKPFAENVQTQQQVALPELENLLTAPKDSILLDVRAPTEFASDHFKDAINIPLDSLDSACSSLCRKKTYVVYCQTGRRSLKAQSLLFQNGFKNVFHLQGGMERVKEHDSI